MLPREEEPIFIPDEAGEDGPADDSKPFVYNTKGLTSEEAKRLLEKHGKKGYLLALEHVGPELIDFYPVDAFVNTACPRIAIDDAVKYAKPLITPYELEVALGEKKWEMGYQFDEIP